MWLGLVELVAGFCVRGLEGSWVLLAGVTDWWGSSVLRAAEVLNPFGEAKGVED